MSSGLDAIENVRLEPFSSEYLGEAIVRSHVWPATKANGACTSNVNPAVSSATGSVATSRAFMMIRFSGAAQHRTRDF